MPATSSGGTREQAAILPALSNPTRGRIQGLELSDWKQCSLVYQPQIRIHIPQYWMISRQPDIRVFYGRGSGEIEMTGYRCDIRAPDAEASADSCPSVMESGKKYEGNQK